MRRLASLCIRRRRAVFAIWVVVLVGFSFAAHGAGNAFSSNFSLPDSDSQRALDLLKQRFPARAGEPVTVVFSSDDGRLSKQRSEIKRTMAALSEAPHVEAVLGPFENPGQVSADGQIGYGVVQMDCPAIELERLVGKPILDIADRSSTDNLTVAAAGPLIKAAEEQPFSGELIAIMIAIAVLLVTFGSVVAMGLPVLTALMALGSSLALLTLATHVLNVAEFTPQLTAMIGLGVGIDYALFIVSRYRRGLAQGLEPDDAIVRSIDTSGRAVLFAGVTVIVSLMGMTLLGIDFMYGLAIASAVSVAMTMLASLTLLPAMLSFVGRKINFLRLPGLGRKSVDDSSGGWHRWSRFIQRNALAVSLLTLAALAGLCVPALDLRLGTSDSGSDSPSTQTRVAYDLLAKGFGPGFNGPLQVAVDLNGASPSSLVGLSNEIAADPGVKAVAPAEFSPGHDAAMIVAVPKSSPQSVETSKLIERLRQQVIPGFERTSGAQAHIGGITAVYDDFSALLAAKLPLFISAVVILSGLLLAVVFRSIPVAIKAVVMSLLSIGAALGVVVVIFQWGFGAELIGLGRAGPIEAFLPVMLFAIVFGLSMDYEVFLLSRIHEEWSKDQDASRAVSDGLAITGRVITAAAAIMVSVFASFALGEDRVIKLFGLGLAAAVLIDALVIRTLLVPAVMELLGRRAWWFPAWLDRRLPKLHVEPVED